METAESPWGSIAPVEVLQAEGRGLQDIPLRSVTGSGHVSRKLASARKSSSSPTFVGSGAVRIAVQDLLPVLWAVTLHHQLIRLAGRHVGTSQH